MVSATKSLICVALSPANFNATTKMVADTSNSAKIAKNRPCGSIWGILAITFPKRVVAVWIAELDTIKINVWRASIHAENENVNARHFPAKRP